jgi:hypothetical protein
MLQGQGFGGGPVRAFSMAVIVSGPVSVGCAIASDLARPALDHKKGTGTRRGRHFPAFARYVRGRSCNLVWYALSYW